MTARCFRAAVANERNDDEEEVVGVELVAVPIDVD